ncbi:NCS2 family permease [Microlunatus soli]|uniref:Putative MFS transporter, AGZA family, xanthine/uracil permease n=1 Tax=Microlunatus soli TaxID=630515 RepID=A0A1H1RK63_9ACTN|nr:NCS2 family permease [Microlunatus soli]SDS36088.1 putative MFS transporter, AGZA family, xanthine/uracil permease [Microlunatus soli]
MATDKADVATRPQQPGKGFIDRWFEISARGSTVGREVRGGLVTFFTMAYIVALNPLIIGTAPDASGNLLGGLPYKDAAGEVIGANVSHAITLVAGATALIAGLCTLAMGVIGRYPLGIATGLGLNALLAFTIAPQMTWPQAMGLVVIEGVVIALLVLTGFRAAVFRAVSPSMRAAISVGLGLFIAFAGLFDAGVIRKPEGSTPVQLGVDGSLSGWPMLVFAIGLFVVAILHVRKVRGAILLSIVIATVVAVIIQAAAGVPARSDDAPTGWALNVPTVGSWISAPDLSLLGDVSVFGAFTSGVQHALPLVMLIFALILSDFFDTMGTVVGVGAEGGLLDKDGNPPHLGPVLMVDALSAAAGGLGSVSSNTAYIESASGVGEGARTGLASVVTGLGFLVAMFFAPLASIVPSEAAAPALVFVGFLMMSQVTKINWTDVEVGLPAFLTIILMPLTYSITTGIGAGFVMLVILKLTRGKAREVHPLLYGIAVAFLIFFLQGLITRLIS